MAGVRTYDPSQVIVTVNSIPISGFTEGTFVEIAREEQSFTKVVGADGLVTRAKTNNYSGSLTITLKQSSPSNDVLSGLITLDELTNAGIFTVLVKDLSGNSVYFSAQAWIRQWPTSTFAREVTDREWILDLANINLFVGSNGENV